MGENILKQLQGVKYKAVFESVKAIPGQFASALNAEIALPQNYKNVKNIVVCGMGGSALGAHIFKALNLSLVPFVFYNDYTPPRYVGEDTLFIASSYSGGTEEALSSAKEAIRRKAKVIGIAAGGTLIDVCKRNNLPFIKFNDKLNPSAQPRYGLGYGPGALFNILIKLGLAEYSMDYAKSAVFNLEEPSINKAFRLAQELKGGAIIVAAAEFLEGNAHALVNQFNESCKLFSEFHSIPELNHHLMEGLKRPAGNKKSVKFLFLESDSYSDRIKARLEVTKDVVKKNGIGYSSYETKGKIELEQVLNCLLFGSLLSLVLTALYKENPVEIPWVEYFKKQLARSNF